jgi:uncharacterized protein (TIGR00730 family)
MTFGPSTREKIEKPPGRGHAFKRTHHDRFSRSARPKRNAISGNPRTESFNAWDPEITAQIDALVQRAKQSDVAEEDISDLVREIVVTALKTQHSQLPRGDAKIFSRSLRELRFGFRVFGPYRHRRKVTIFGSARTRSVRRGLQAGPGLSRVKWFSGGLWSSPGPGPASCRPATRARDRKTVLASISAFPYEQSTNAYVDRGDRFIDCRFFFTRKLMFVKEANAVALFPGGFGTHDEGMEVLTLVQTGKADPMPIVFIDTPGGDYWKDWERYVRKHLLKRGKIAEEDFNLFTVTDSVTKAADEIAHFYKNYHSVRYVRDRMVIRLQRPIPQSEPGSLESQFKDILLKGAHFVNQGALPEEDRFLKPSPVGVPLQPFQLRPVPPPHQRPQRILTGILIGLVIWALIRELRGGSMFKEIP